MDPRPVTESREELRTMVTSSGVPVTLRRVRVLEEIGLTRVALSVGDMSTQFLTDDPSRIRIVLADEVAFVAYPYEHRWREIMLGTRRMRRHDLCTVTLDPSEEVLSFRWWGLPAMVVTRRGASTLLLQKSDRSGEWIPTSLAGVVDWVQPLRDGSVVFVLCTSRTHELTGDHFMRIFRDGTLLASGFFLGATPDSIAWPPHAASPSIDMLELPMDGLEDDAVLVYLPLAIPCEHAFDIC